MGPRLAEPVNEIAGDDVTPIPLNPRNRHTPDTFLTENLWGVGSTAPYMHDGRATTLSEAIIEHAATSDNVSEARFARAAYLGRRTSDKAALIAFLNNLVLFKLEERGRAGRRGGCAAGADRTLEPATDASRSRRRASGFDSNSSPPTTRHARRRPPMPEGRRGLFGEGD